MRQQAIFDEGAIPVDETAGRVISTGTHYDPRVKASSRVESRIPLPTRPLDPQIQYLRPLIGMRFGRLTVIGLSETPKRWVVRCDCGVYGLRSAKAIQNPRNSQDSCDACAYILQIKRKEIRRRTGKDIDVEDIPGAAPAREAKPPLKAPKGNNWSYWKKKRQQTNIRTPHQPPPEPHPGALALALREAKNKQQ